MEITFKNLAFFIVRRFVKKIQKEENRGFISFFFTAILGASVNFISRIFFEPILSSFLDSYSYEWSVFCAYTVATIITFIPSKNFAFAARDSGNTQREYIKFFLIAFLALGVQVLIAGGSLKYIVNPILGSFPELLQKTVAHVFGMGCSFFANYYGHKFLTFKSTGIYDKIKGDNKNIS